ncbi:unnamed protein product [Amoebophrya sp. A25]|nr:unnamed protein product [Amoebophrya sp. A25]|eukprot:GSA25T00000080001.1
MPYFWLSKTYQTRQLAFKPTTAGMRFNSVHGKLGYSVSEASNRVMVSGRIGIVPQEMPDVVTVTMRGYVQTTQNEQELFSGTPVLANGWGNIFGRYRRVGERGKKGYPWYRRRAGVLSGELFFGGVGKWQFIIRRLVHDPGNTGRHVSEEILVEEADPGPKPTERNPATSDWNMLHVVSDGRTDRLVAGAELKCTLSGHPMQPSQGSVFHWAINTGEFLMQFVPPKGFFLERGKRHMVACTLSDPKTHADNDQHHLVRLQWKAGGGSFKNKKNGASGLGLAEGASGVAQNAKKADTSYQITHTAIPLGAALTAFSGGSRDLAKIKATGKVGTTVETKAKDHPAAAGAKAVGGNLKGLLKGDASSQTIDSLEAAVMLPRAVFTSSPGIEPVNPRERHALVFQFTGAAKDKIHFHLVAEDFYDRRRILLGLPTGIRILGRDVSLDELQEGKEVWTLDGKDGVKPGPDNMFTGSPGARFIFIATPVDREFGGDSRRFTLHIPWRTIDFLSRYIVPCLILSVVALLVLYHFTFRFIFDPSYRDRFFTSAGGASGWLVYTWLWVAALVFASLLALLVWWYLISLLCRIFFQEDGEISYLCLFALSNIGSVLVWRKRADIIAFLRPRNAATRNIERKINEIVSGDMERDLLELQTHLLDRYFTLASTEKRLRGMALSDELVSLLQELQSRSDKAQELLHHTLHEVRKLYAELSPTVFASLEQIPDFYAANVDPPHPAGDAGSFVSFPGNGEGPARVETMGFVRAGAIDHHPSQLGVVIRRQSTADDESIDQVKVVNQENSTYTSLDRDNSSSEDAAGEMKAAKNVPVLRFDPFDPRATVESASDSETVRLTANKTAEMVHDPRATNLSRVRFLSTDERESRASEPRLWNSNRSSVAGSRREGGSRLSEDRETLLPVPEGAPRPKGSASFLLPQPSGGCVWWWRNRSVRIEEWIDMLSLAIGKIGSTQRDRLTFFTDQAKWGRAHFISVLEKTVALFNEPDMTIDDLGLHCDAVFERWNAENPETKIEAKPFPGENHLVHDSERRLSAGIDHLPRLVGHGNFCRLQMGDLKEHLAASLKLRNMEHRLPKTFNIDGGDPSTAHQGDGRTTLLPGMVGLFGSVNSGPPLSQSYLLDNHSFASTGPNINTASGPATSVTSIAAGASSLARPDIVTSPSERKSSEAEIDPGDFVPERFITDNLRCRVIFASPSAMLVFFWYLVYSVEEFEVIGLRNGLRNGLVVPDLVVTVKMAVPEFDGELELLCEIVLRLEAYALTRDIEYTFAKIAHATSIATFLEPLFPSLFEEVLEEQFIAAKRAGQGDNFLHYTSGDDDKKKARAKAAGPDVGAA